MNKFENFIPAWRILFVYIVMAFHLCNAYGIATGWYIGVEFFFIVSGYLLADTVERKKFCSAYSYTVYRIKKLYPHYLFSFLVAWGGVIYLNNYNVLAAIKLLMDSVFEIMMLSMIGINLTKMLNVPTWYLSAMLISGFFLFYLLNKYQDIFKNIIAPTSIIIIYSWMYRNVGSIQYSALGEDIVFGIYGNIPLFRGFADMCMGVLIYYVPKAGLGTMVNNIPLTGKIIVEFFCFGSTILVTYFFYNTTYDFICIIMLCVGIKISFMEHETIVIKSRVIKYMAQLSYPLFLNHNMFRKIIPKFFVEINMAVVIFYFLSVTIYSAISMFFVNSLNKKINKLEESVNVG